ncbi:putative membrane protein [Clostridioides difficile 824]|nr:putative membrane protein [Clostridioides difficile CD44]EQE93679.1 putative membrane protein [Clostridioides difficile CD104]EQF42101.1 putative membrane protein [Clostridioides difficile CD169]EQF71368.1 putative membrane protein [Clostridioides difficile CD201]EQF72227.1 putative membrane protein [Clostridioides difficile CD206]EQF97106.1 putative membrane protein [Clostridioides difficile 824]EQG49141.1 putative membrane protein [Clostridioides difficile DA00134]EQG54619.1 putative me
MITICPSIVQLHIANIIVMCISIVITYSMYDNYMSKYSNYI